MEIWEINLGGTVQGYTLKGLCYGVREFGCSLTRVHRSSRTVGFLGPVIHRVGVEPRGTVLG